MFLDFFYLLKKEGIPVSLQEYLALLESLEKEVIGKSIEEFYFLAKTVFVKTETHLDRFDKLFGNFFKGMQYIPDNFIKKIPEEWLRKNFERMFSEEEKAMIEAMGGLDKLMERFKELMKEQKERHEGGNRWIGTGGTSPFGANGYNPEGIRMGQEGSRMRSAVKVWDQRDFANLDDKVELNTRNIKMALKRLRHFTREGFADELDLDDTIQKTSENGGYLDIKMIPSKLNRVKVLMFMDVGGSMDDHIELCSRLFSASKHEFKHLEFYYFHNCIYESVWTDNKLRNKRVNILDVINKYNKDYKVIFVGDAAMSPYELVLENGAISHYNDESGLTWMQRIKMKFPNMVWINPNRESSWQFFQTTGMLKEFMNDRMFPMTIEGITLAMKSLKKKKQTAN